MHKYLPTDKINKKIIISHLGQGASMCALENKKSITTTFGFSTLDGLPMGTRCGNIDPGVLLYLMRKYNMNCEQIENLLFHKSGLLGVSNNLSNDMRILLDSDDSDAKLAIDLFVYRTNALIGMLYAQLNGLDVLIFTAGIGENSYIIRKKICEKLGWLNAKIDEKKNNNNENDLTHKDSKILIYKIQTDEELIIARHTYKILLNINNGGYEWN